MAHQRRRLPDWNCPSCKDLVFGSKPACRCGTQNPARVATGAGPSTGTVPAQMGRHPDWNCPSCKDLVFGSKSCCRKCGVPNPARTATPSAPTPAASSSTVPAQTGRLPDWNCPSCKDLVFGSKPACRCGTQNPARTTAPSVAPAASSTVPAQMGRQPDWNCPSCKDLVFGSKSCCRKCGVPNPARTATPSAPTPAASSSTVPAQTGRLPDWNCPSCKDLVFGSKPVCRCGTQNPARTTTPSVAPAASSTVPAQMGRQPDWNCPSCNDLVFGSKSCCRKCGVPNPARTATPSATPTPAASSVPAQTGRLPDWNCPSCKDLVFGSKPACRCGTQNPARTTTTTTTTTTTHTSIRAGDWKCPSCSDIQFGSRALCRRCGTPRDTLTNPYPAHWDKQDANLLVVDLDMAGDEAAEVLKRFATTMPGHTVRSVQRLQNKALWRKYAVEREIMQEAGNATTSRMFHGTRGTAPDLVYNGQDGFDMRFCTSGLWGIASYFAANAKYSHSYAYNAGAVKQMFVAQVLVGHTKDYDTTSKKDLRMPPEMPKIHDKNDGPAVRRYDSVSGCTGGSRVVMVYGNGRAYPEYLLSYTG